MIRFKLRPYLLFLTCICCCQIPFALPQTPQPQQPESPGLVIKKNVRRVILDVVVTGKNGVPATELTRDDFTLTEDGKTQRILSFDAHAIDGPPDFVPPKLPPMSVNTFVNLPSAPERGPLYLILYDMVNMEIDDQPYARKQLLKFLESKPEGSRFAIMVLSDGMYLVQGFTGDKEKLLAAVNQRGARHVPEVFLYAANFGKNDTLHSVSVFTQIAQYLSGLPGRKNILWFSGEFPLTLFANSDSPESMNVDYSQEVREAINTIARDQISIYPVDVRGVVVTEAYAPSGATPSGGASRPGPQAVNPASQSTAASQNAQGHGASLLASSYMTEDEIAKETGGRAFYSRNDLTAALADATVNGGTYYTVTYSPSNEKYDGKLRHIRVALSRPGYQLAYRRYYFADDPGEPKRPSPPNKEPQNKDADLPGADQTIGSISNALNASMGHGAPIAHELVFVAHMHTVGSPVMATPEQMSELVQQPASLRGGRRSRPAKPPPPVKIQTVSINYQVFDSRLRSIAAATGSKSPSLVFAAVAYDQDGLMLSNIAQNVDCEESSQPGEQGKGIYRVQLRLNVPMNAAWLRVGVEDTLTDRLGTLEVSLPLAPEQQTQAAAPAKTP